MQPVRCIHRPAGPYGRTGAPMDVAANGSEDLPQTRGVVLVVEDQAELRQAIGELLEEEGFRVELAGDGSQAIADASREEPDVVLMDLRLPGADGLEAVQQSKSTRSPGAVHRAFLVRGPGDQ